MNLVLLRGWLSLYHMRCPVQYAEEQDASNLDNSSPIVHFVTRQEDDWFVLLSFRYICVFVCAGRLVCSLHWLCFLFDLCCVCLTKAHVFFDVVGRHAYEKDPHSVRITRC